MSAHLRIVEEPERTYIVARTQLVTPGRPYVVAECTPGALVSPPAGLESLGRSTMLGRTLLREALEAWEAHDDTLADRERQARAALGREGEIARSRAMHPSGRAPQMRHRGPLG